MKVVLQRVKKASVSVGGEEKAAIGGGLLLLVGVAKGDGPQAAKKMARKIAALRVFEDKAGKMNLSVSDAVGEILSVPQFTLLASTGKGNRPGFDLAAPPEEAKALWDEFNGELAASGVNVSKGEFASHMEVSLVNDGPVTLILESKEGE